ncbi:nucleotidyltransferase family protein [Pseudooceanicola sp.]|uniref:nucleotidyltransferase family protein n=1 Tax=Pseudooceanicola sp. TaxID=1914328 RepID=UPI00261B2054|nr:nucleotidyltransferase family protein [Pseudooceanicola sp.]MDF1854934.1 nucleotidyltransferase family protein [Pseudooceanicola sp.]
MRNPPDSLMIFAAGFGTRMGALTSARPKPLVRVAGRALIDHALDVAAPIAPEVIVVNTHYRADQMQAHLAGRGVVISHETPEILESGGGLRQALPLLGDGPVMTLNSDVVWDRANPLTLLRQAWDPAQMDALLLCVEPENAIGRRGGGDFSCGPDGRLARGGPVIYTGAQIIATGSLAGVDQPVFSLNLIWDQMIAAGRLFGLTYPGRWCDVGTPEGIALAEAMIAAADV